MVYTYLHVRRKMDRSVHSIHQSVISVQYSVFIGSSVLGKSSSSLRDMCRRASLASQGFFTKNDIFEATIIIYLPKLPTLIVSTALFPDREIIS